MGKKELALGEDVLYTISEVASLLKVNKNMVYDLINQGYLKSIKFGCRKVTRKALLEFLEQYDGEELPITPPRKGRSSSVK
ncbi:MAG: helix-turn-helix domain-containing protein [Muribaculum sp.]|nr:helix-turn-helix domain-containing protein [Muribaculum sp.]